MRVKYLGRRGSLSLFMRGLGRIAPEERPLWGNALNIAKDWLTDAISTRAAELGRAALEQRLAAERADVTLPVPFAGEGRIHPISQTIDEIVAIFGEMGFVVAEGPHIEEDFYNFTALNIPPEHPARQEHDTFYSARARSTARGWCCAPTPRRCRSARCWRNSRRSGSSCRAAPSAATTTRPIRRCSTRSRGWSSTATTHMGHLKGCLIEFCRAYFGLDDLPVRFRPSYFPFTEPSAEVDIGCSRQGGRLEIGAGGDWLEILGSGMVHPKVLQNCGIDPAQYQGFAFGMGIERVAMLKYGIPDLRTFYDSDLRWLRHYGFLPLDIPSLVRGPLTGAGAA